MTATPQNVTVLGLGRMGSALARSFDAAGHKVTAWNRSAGPRDAATGFCTPVEAVADAVAASDLIVTCLADYDSTMEALAGVSSEQWAGRTMVQLASGGPEDAHGMKAWADARGIAYIDGAIATFPDRMGAADTCIFMSGDRAAHDRHEATLAAMGGRNLFASDDVAAAASLDLAWLSLLYGVTLGMLSAAAFCEAGKVSPKHFFNTMPSFMPEIAHAAKEYDDMIARDSYEGDQAMISVHLAAMEHIGGAAASAGMDTRFTDMLLGMFKEAVDRGLGELEIAAAIKVLRGKEG
jgi:3-hydroxyisobutyrate dehydrogenase-like beta-hydroxyacid dehydrogenase